MVYDFASSETADPFFPKPKVEKTFFWIKAWMDGRKVVLGPYNTQEEANQAGYEKIDGDFDVIPLKTRDMRRAVHALRVEEEGEITPSTFNRTRHVI